MSPREGGWLETSAPGQDPGTHCRPSSGLTWTTCKMMYMYIHRLKLHLDRYTCTVHILSITNVHVHVHVYVQLHVPYFLE